MPGGQVADRIGAGVVHGQRVGRGVNGQAGVHEHRAQLLAVPYPYCDPRNWELQLDLQTGVESYVAVALAGVLILLGSVIVCLEARDNFSDANEKRRMATAMPL